MADAVRKAGQPIFWTKMACIACAVVILVKIRPFIKGASDADSQPAPARARRLAVASLIFWTGAIVAGRLVAYLT